MGTIIEFKSKVKTYDDSRIRISDLTDAIANSLEASIESQGQRGIFDMFGLTPENTRFGIVECTGGYAKLNLGDAVLVAINTGDIINDRERYIDMGDVCMAFRVMGEN